MRHTIHIMLGANFRKIICGVKEYITKYGSKDENKYFSAFLYEAGSSTSTFNVVENQDSAPNVFISDIDDMYKSKISSFYEVNNCNRQEYLANYFSTLFNDRVNINDPGDANTLYVTIYVPLYKSEFWHETKDFIEAIERLPQRISVDLFLISEDLSHLFEPNISELVEEVDAIKKQSLVTLKEIVEFKKQSSRVAHLMYLQNFNTQGVSLNLSEASFVRIIGEYALLLINHYQEVFNPAANDLTKPLYSLGLSIIDFDKYYFVQYLLHKAYVYILDREGIMQDEVDVNKVSQKVQHILKENINIFTSFFQKYILPKIQSGSRDDEISASIRPELMDEIKKLTNDFQAFIDDPEMSLPEKKATLAQLLGEDDSLLVGYMFNKKQLVIDDCSREVLDLFVALNNQLVNTALSVKRDEDAAPDPKEALMDYAVLSDSTKLPMKPASEIINELKSLKVAMRSSSNYIRLKSEELDGLSVQIQENIDSHKRLTSEGFIFEGHLYQLQTQIETNLEEDYVPQHGDLPQEMDLRQFFTPIKDQGEIGACSVFTIVGLFEYLLKRNKEKNPDLSEKFVYYNVRKHTGNCSEDTGSTLHSVVTTMSEEGVCLENLCPYNDRYDECPSEEAYVDAKHRKIIKALNVKPTLDDIRSAIAQGYPVAISLKIYESFAPLFGFIPHPTNEETENNSGNHAMIIAGYSDTKKIFIVRNSWGTNFGDQGYCYIPYSYVGDTRFLNSACIVQEVSGVSVTLDHKDNKTTVDFDMSNSKIKSIILQNLIEEEKITLGKLGRACEEKTIEYNTLFQVLGNNSVRDSLLDGTKRRLELELSDLSQNQDQKVNDKSQRLSMFDQEKRTKIGLAALLYTGLIALFGILCWIFNAKDILLNTYSYITYSLAALGGIFLYLWHNQIKHKRIVLKEDLEEEINRVVDRITEKKRQISELHLKTHTAGMIIDSFSILLKNLHSKYNGMRSFVENLRTWREEEALVQQQIPPIAKYPFLSLISTEQLDRYFEGHSNICDNLHLYSMFKNKYQISETAIIGFKNGLKKSLIDSLFESVKDFSIYSYLKGEKTYMYAAPIDEIDALFRKMENMSYLFVRNSSSIEAQNQNTENAKILILETGNIDKKIIQNFRDVPQVICTTNTYKISLLQIGCFSLEDIN